MMTETSSAKTPPSIITSASVSLDPLSWLKETRDKYCVLRDQCYGKDQWAEGNVYNEFVEGLYAAIVEIEKSRKRLTVFTEVLLNRIEIAHSKSLGDGQEKG